jgi:hypothetical protein
MAAEPKLSITLPEYADDEIIFNALKDGEQ